MTSLVLAHLRRPLCRSFFVLVLGSCLNAAEVIFEDSFGSGSRGELRDNLVSRPPPEGMGYETKVPAGHLLRHWRIADAEADGPRRAFWVIPVLEGGMVADYAEQAGRSRNSVAYAGTPVPADATHYVIEFRQRANDNDTIAFVLGASKPVLPHDGVEIAYQRQLPGTDETVPDVYYRTPWGEGVIKDRAFMHQWVEHRIEVRGSRVSWSQNGELMLSGEVPAMSAGGWFGIRQAYERGTRYDDVKISVLQTSRVPSGPKSSVRPAAEDRSMVASTAPAGR